MRPSSCDVCRAGKRRCEMAPGAKTCKRCARLGYKCVPYVPPPEEGSPRKKGKKRPAPRSSSSDGKSSVAKASAAQEASSPREKTHAGTMVGEQDAALPLEEAVDVSCGHQYHSDDDLLEDDDDVCEEEGKTEDDDDDARGVIMLSAGGERAVEGKGQPTRAEVQSHVCEWRDSPAATSSWGSTALMAAIPRPVLANFVISQVTQTIVQGFVYRGVRGLLDQTKLSNILRGIGCWNSTLGRDSVRLYRDVFHWACSQVLQPSAIKALEYHYELPRTPPAPFTGGRNRVAMAALMRDDYCYGKITYAAGTTPTVVINENMSRMFLSREEAEGFLKQTDLHFIYVWSSILSPDSIPPLYDLLNSICTEKGVDGSLTANVTCRTRFGQEVHMVAAMAQDSDPFTSSTLLTLMTPAQAREAQLAMHAPDIFPSQLRMTPPTSATVAPVTQSPATQPLSPPLRTQKTTLPTSAAVWHSSPACADVGTYVEASMGASSVCGADEGAVVSLVGKNGGVEAVVTDNSMVKGDAMHDDLFEYVDDAALAHELCEPLSEWLE